MHRKSQFHNLLCCTISFVARATLATAITFVLTVIVTRPAQAQGGCALCLSDDFAVWTTSSSFLNTLAQDSSNPPGTFVVPTLGYSQLGLQVSGLGQEYQMTGLQSLRAFSAPFTFTTLATATQGTANPIAIFLASADLTHYLTVSVNFSTTYDGIWADANNIDPLWQLGEQFSPPIVPALDTLYQFTVTVDASGDATVTVESSDGMPLGTLTGLTPGTGPFYVVLGQKIGDAPAGPQTASYKSVSLHP